MHRRRALGTVVVTAVVLGILVACSDDGGGADDRADGAAEEVATAVDDLGALEGLRAASEAQFATFARADGAVGGVAGAFPVGDAGVEGFLAEHAGLFGLDQPGIGLVAVADEPAPGEDGTRVLRYRQTYRGVPVAGGDLVVSVDVGDDGQVVVRSVTGGDLPPLALEVRPVLTPPQAIEAAVGAAGGGSARVAPELVIVDRSADDEGAPLEAALAWWVVVTGPAGGTLVTVDAGSPDGTVLSSVPLGAAATPDDLDVWNTYGTPEAEFVEDVLCTEEGDLYATEDGRVPGVRFDQVSQDGWMSLLDVYDYYLDEFRLDSYDGDGDTLQLRTNVVMARPGNSAFWEDMCEAIHINENGTGVETIAHEYGHGVVDDRTGNPYDNPDFTAINESFADVFASGIEDDWVLIGRDASVPRTYERDWRPGGEEHDNSRVPTHAWWLIAHGQDETILGISSQRARALALSTLSRMPDDTRLIELGSVARFAAILRGYDRDDLCTVVRAWTYVLGQRSGLPGCQYADTDGDGTPDRVDDCDGSVGVDTDHDGQSDPCDEDDDGDGIGDADDRCPTTPDPANRDLDGDGLGDACDPDRDGDGFDDDEDTCPNVPNPQQRIGAVRNSLADQDFDGIDDACDPLVDTDGDEVANGADNCTWDWNPDQADTDGDGIGDACEIDTDGDGIDDLEDLCSLVADPDQANADGDLLGDACDPCPEGEDQVIASLPPFDPDGPGGLPPIGEPRSVLNDEDGDGIPDGCDDGPIIRLAGPVAMQAIGPRLAFGDPGGGGGRGFELPSPCGSADAGDGDSPSGTTVRARVVVTDLADGARVGILGPDGGVLDAPPADEGGGFTLEAEVAPGTSLLLVVVGGPDGAGAGTRGQQPTTADRHVMATAEVQYAPCADPGDDPHPSTPTFLPAPEAGEVPTTAPGRTSEGRPDQAVDTTAGEGTTDTAAAGGPGGTIGTVGTIPPLGTVPRPGQTTTTRPRFSTTVVPCIQVVPPPGQTTTTRPPGTPCSTTTTIGVGTIPPIGTVPPPPTIATTTTNRFGTVPRPTIGTG